MHLKVLCEQFREVKTRAICVCFLKEAQAGEHGQGFKHISTSKLSFKHVCMINT